VTAQPARHGVGDCESSAMEEVVVVGKQRVRQAAILAAGCWWFAWQALSPQQPSLNVGSTPDR
jgi:hypothetical protein